LEGLLYYSALIIREGVSTLSGFTTLLNGTYGTIRAFRSFESLYLKPRPEVDRIYRLALIVFMSINLAVTAYLVLMTPTRASTSIFGFLKIIPANLINFRVSKYLGCIVDKCGLPQTQKIVPQLLSDDGYPFEEYDTTRFETFETNTGFSSLPD
jgi:hypothetical protein